MSTQRDTHGITGSGRVGFSLNGRTQPQSLRPWSQSLKPIERARQFAAGTVGDSADPPVERSSKWSETGDIAFSRPEKVSDLQLIERKPFFPQLSHANKGTGSAVLIVASDPRQSSPKIADVLRNDDAVLPEKTADLIDQPDAIGNQATANPDELPPLPAARK
jgi:hypothetical protein